ncbi:hypothetical protein [Nocardia jinanensis]|nr:hypothetical protein [Nocardia jinanensis]
MADTVDALREQLVRRAAPALARRHSGEKLRRGNDSLEGGGDRAGEASVADVATSRADGAEPGHLHTSAVRVSQDADPTFLDIRERLFVRGDAAARTAWGRELMELTELGYGRQADHHLEQVLGLPEYRYHETRGADRPVAPFEGLSAELAGRPGVHAPEPSRMVYLSPVAKALNLTPDDVVYDIGSGLGKAGLFFGGFTPAKRVVGLEIEPAYAMFADRRARELGLSHVSFANRDALEADISDGTAFYFYNPFGSTPDRDAVGMLADRFAELGSAKDIQIAVKGKPLQTRLDETGVFSAETVLEDPAVWKVFRSHQDPS